MVPKKKILVAAAIVVIVGIVFASYSNYVQTKAYEREKIISQAGNGTDYIQAVIEEEGVLKIKETSEYKTLIDEYGDNIVSVKATNLLEVKDTLFLQEIDEGFEQNPGSLIVLEYQNNQGFIYQLDKELNIVYRMDLKEFTESSQKVNSKTMDNFYTSLK